MPSTIKELLSSKKFLTAVIGVVMMFVAYGVGKLGIGLDPDKATEYVVALFAVLLGGQGLADVGKAKAQIAADALQQQVGGAAGQAVPPPPSPPSSPK
jgi:uncharacterized membrane protein